MGLGPAQWYAVTPGSTLDLTPATAPPEECERPLPSRWQPFDKMTHEASRERGLRVEYSGCCDVSLIAADGHVLARHATGWGLADRIWVHHYSWSAEGKRIAYGLSHDISWWFARPVRNFVVDRQHEYPLRVGSGIHAFAWLDEHRLVGCGSRSGSPQGNALRLWHFSG